jgi:hypothetical protein
LVTSTADHSVWSVDSPPFALKDDPALQRHRLLKLIPSPFPYFDASTLSANSPAPLNMVRSGFALVTSAANHSVRSLASKPLAL